MRLDEGVPVGWILVPLAKLLIGIETGKSFKCEERTPTGGEVGVVKVSSVTWGTYQESESKTCMDSERVNPELFVRPGDFLFSRANTIGLVGACVIAQKVTLRVMLSDKILRLRFKNEDMKPWVLRLLRSEHGRRQIEALASGNQDSMRNIGQERIGQILIPVPPNAERTRVADKLEELLSDLDAGVAELKAAQKKLTQYRQSLLKAAVEGRLTEAWRAQHGEPEESGGQLLARILRKRRARWEAEQLAKFGVQGKKPPKDWQLNYEEPSTAPEANLAELPDGWAWATMAQLIDTLTSGSRDWSTFYDRGTCTFVMAQNVRPWRPDFTFKQLVDPPLGHRDRARSMIEKDDLLITIVGANTGQACRVDKKLDDHFVCQSVALIRLSDCALSEYVNAVLNSPEHGQRQFREMNYGAGRPHLSFDQLESVLVPLPPLTEQQELIRQFEHAQSLIESVDVQVAKASRFCAAQRKNILQAAFSGQLVPQDPNDEPTSVLLERIRAERVAHDGASTMRRRKPKEKDIA